MTVRARLAAPDTAPVTSPDRSEICLVSSIWMPINPARGSMSHLNTIYPYILSGVPLQLLLAMQTCTNETIQQNGVDKVVLVNVHRM